MVQKQVGPFALFGRVAGAALRSGVATAFAGAAGLPDEGMALVSEARGARSDRGASGSPGSGTGASTLPSLSSTATTGAPSLRPAPPKIAPTATAIATSGTP